MKEPDQLPSRAALQPSPRPGPQEVAECAELMPMYLAEVPAAEHAKASAQAVQMGSDELELALWVERVCNEEDLRGDPRARRREELSRCTVEELERLRNRARGAPRKPGRRRSA